LDFSEGPRAMYEAYKTYKSFLWLIGGILCLFLSGRHYLRSREDAAPLPVNVADVQSVAADHHWLAVTGRLLTRSAVERTFHGKSGDTYSIYVPLVPAAWTPAQSVHAVVMFNGKTRNDAAAAISAVMRRGGDASQIAVTGTQDDFSRADLFPSLQVSGDAILIRHGSTPPSPSEILLMGGLGVAGVTVGGARLVRRTSSNQFS
jgi:hypothetical protein